MTQSSQQNTPASPFSKSAKRQQKMQAILHIAAQNFNVKGVAATTLVDITKALNVTKASLYYYVRNKEDLTYLSYQNTLDILHGFLASAKQTQQTAFAIILNFIDNYFEHCLTVEKGDAPAFAMLHEIETLKTPQKEDIKQRYFDLQKDLTTLIEQGVENKTLSVNNPLVLAHCILTTMQWVATAMTTENIEKMQEATTTFKSILQQGIASWSSTISQDRLPLPKHAFIDPFDKEGARNIRQNAFVNTAAKLFNQKGYKGVSLDEIAQSLEVTKGAFYYHLETKEALLTLCFDTTLQTLNETITLAEARGNSGLSKLMLASTRLFAIQHANTTSLIHHSLSKYLPKDIRDDYSKKIHHLFERFGGFIREGLHDRSIRGIRAHTCQDILLNMILSRESLFKDDDFNAIKDITQKDLSFIVTGIERKS